MIKINTEKKSEMTKRTPVKLGWYFPSGVDIRKESVNNPSMQFFVDHILDSLPRETIQNSLDAVKDSNIPVRITIEDMEIESSQFPGKEYFNEKVIPKAKKTWIGDEKTQIFLNDFHEILSCEKINVLKISDYNTKGLIGADGEGLRSPWKALIEEVGSSTKEEGSAGSFGIGKAAPFAGSDIRTVFYNTKIESGEYSIGVSNMVSFDWDDIKTAQGVGYYGYKKKPIEDMVPFDPEGNRTELGTDIYIMGFNQVNKWDEIIIGSIVNNFLVSIYNEKLSVKVKDTQINKESLPLIIDNLDDVEFKELKNYYDVLTSDKTIQISLPKEFSKYGFNPKDAKLLLLKSEDANRKILLTRKAGMKIFDRGHISRNIQFTGIFQATGNDINEMLKNMENPSHNKWVASRYSKDEKLAEKFLKELYSFIKKSVIDNFEEVISEEVDAYGIGDFLPDLSNPNIDNSEKENQDEDEVESGNIVTVKFIDSNVIKSKPGSNTNNKLGGKDDTDENGGTDGDSGTGGNGNTEGDGVTDGDGGTSGNGGTGGDSSKGGNKEKDLKEAIKDKNQLKDFIVKVVEQRSDQGEYSIMFIPQKNYKKGLIFRITVIGEQFNTTLEILEARYNNLDCEIEKDLFIVDNLKKGIVNKLDIKLDFNDRLKLGVNVYEDKR